MDLNVGKQNVVITYGDSRAAAHAAQLLREEAVVTVIAPSVVATIEDLAARELVTWHRRSVTDADIAGAYLVLNAGAAPDPDQTAAPKAHTPGGRPVDTSPGGSVTLVGGGPGDPALITLAGRAAIQEADVLVTDRLCPPEALAWARDDAEIIDVGKIPGGRSTSQDTINQMMIERARAGRYVVRYKGGDSFVFGRGGEELIACAQAHVAVRVIPGVSSAIAAPACAGIPLTHRGLAQGVTVVTGHAAPSDQASTIDWDALARSGTTIVVLMGVRTLAAIADALLGGGLSPATPAAVIADGALPSQQVVTADLRTIAHAADTAEIGPPAVTVIGDVAGLDLLGLAAQCAAQEQTSQPAAGEPEPLSHAHT